MISWVVCGEELILYHSASDWSTQPLLLSQSSKGTASQVSRPIGNVCTVPVATLPSDMTKAGGWETRLI